MVNIFVSSNPVTEGFQLTWEDNSVSLFTQGREAQYNWEFVQSQGLYGKYGISLDLKDCLLTDILLALSVSLGEEHVSWSEKGYDVLRRELESEKANPLPAGAVH